MKFHYARDKAVGPALAAVLPSDGKPWYRKRHLIRLNYSLVSIFLLSSAVGFDGSIMNGLQALPQWHVFMNHPTGAWLGFINAVQALGALAVYPFVEYVVDHWGRKKCMIPGYIALAIGVSLQTAAVNPGMFVAGRVFIGTTSAFWGLAAPLLITESAYPTHRANLTAAYNCGYYLGSLVAAWATFGTRNYSSSWAWRLPSILQFVVPGIALPGVYFAPESPRWLVSRSRLDEATRFFTKYHANGDANSPLVAFEVQEVTETLAMEQQAKESKWKDLIATPGNRRRLLISVSIGIFSQWNGYGIVSYYLSPVLTTVGVTTVTDQTMISGFLQLWNLTLSLIAAFSVDIVGRRVLWRSAYIGMFLTYIVISALSGSFAKTGDRATGLAVVPMLFIYYAFYDIITPMMFSYVCEIWPYTLRARGIIITLVTIQSAVFLNIFANPIALEAIGWKYYVIYCVILVFIIVSVWLVYPETKGHSLEEMARVFDGDKAALPNEIDLAQQINEHAAEKQLATDHVEDVKV